MSNIPETNQTAATQSVARAIEQSIREGQVVILRSTADTIEWRDLTSALAQIADHWEQSAERVREYCGKDADGDEWKISLRWSRSL